MGECKTQEASAPDVDDLRRLNIELQRRVTELEALFELAPVGLAIARDAECLHIEPNPAFRRLLRLSIAGNASRSAPPEQRPKHFRVVQDGVELAPEDLPMQIVARTGLPINGSECQVEFDDGTITYLLGSTTPLFDEQARPRGCIGAFLDITERKRAEQAIRENERYVRGMLDALPQHVAVLNEHGVIEAVNLPWQRFAEANGCAASAVSVGTDYLAVCRDAAASGDPIAGEVVRLLSEMLSGQRADFTLEYPCPAPNQNQWFVMRAQRNAHGSRGAVISHIDITKRKLAEDSIRASEARLAAALEGGRMGLWEWDLQTNTSVWNATEYQLLGLPVGAGNVPTSLFFDRVHADDAGLFNQILSEVMEAGSEFYHEVRIRRADGQERWLAAAGQLSRDASGLPSKMVGVNYDITDRKLAERNLREARAEAEAANRAKDRFLAILSHELRGPLSPIVSALAYWETVAEQLPPDLRQDMGMIQRNIELQVRLIDDLLDFNRIVSGKLAVRPQPADLHVLLRRCVDANRGQLDSKGLAVALNLRASSGEIIADPARLEQVFGNVLRNAIKFTATGRIDVETEDLFGENPKTRMVRVRIRDTGVGIGAGVSPETLFEPFEQGGNDRTREYGGLGLGLSICRGFVHAHGGRISAASDGPGTGTLITIDLPIGPVTSV